MEVTIKKTGINGEGIGYINKIPVFVENALVDEVVDIKIKENKGKYKTAEVVRYIKKSPLRVKEKCPYCKKCGGCSLLNTTYENQLTIKKSLVEEAFAKYADMEVSVDIIGSDKTEGYRNSLKLPFCNVKGQLATGLYQEDSNFIVQVDNCLNHEEVLEEAKKEFLKIANRFHLQAFDNKTKKGLRHLVMRHIDGKIQICLVTGQDQLDKKFVEAINNMDKVVSFYQNINTSKSSSSIFSNKMIRLSEKKYLSFKVEKLRPNLSIRSFFQLNTEQAKKLYRYAVDLIPENNELLVEAYCGIGTMSMLAAKKAKKVVGIEIIEDAISNAERTAKLNEIDNCEFIVGDAAEIMASRFKKKTIDTLLVDPPRSGLDDNMIDCISKGDINNIIYISCNPATLAKNINELKKKYVIKSIQSFDMFPNTPHVETVVLLSKVNTPKG